MTQKNRCRLDVLLVEKGLAPSREKARAAVMAGLVTVDGRKIDKPGYKVDRLAEIKVAAGTKYVSRGGAKTRKGTGFFSD